MVHVVSRQQVEACTQLLAVIAIALAIALRTGHDALEHIRFLRTTTTTRACDASEPHLRSQPQEQDSSHSLGMLHRTGERILAALR